MTCCVSNHVHFVGVVSAATTRHDSCRRSKNGTMDLFLEPPWAYVNYVSHVSWTVKFIDELPPNEQLSSDEPHVDDDSTET